MLSKMSKLWSTPVMRPMNGFARSLMKLTQERADAPLKNFKDIRG